MAIEPVSYGNRTEQASALRQVEARAAEAAPDPAKLVDAAPPALAGLSPFAAEARRSNELAAAAKATSVALVTQPVEAVGTEPVTTVVEQIEPVEAGLRQAQDSRVEAYRSNAAEQADPFSAISAGRTLSRVA